MPNGWYPVDDLAILHINQTEQQYPRFEWTQSWDVLRCISFRGANGYTTREPVRWPRKQYDIAGLIDEATRAISEPSLPQGATNAYALAIDFKQRVGAAVGGFWIYAVNSSVLRTIHDPSIIPMIREAGQSLADLQDYMYDVIRSAIGASDERPAGETFSFADADGLLCTSFPIIADRLADKRSQGASLHDFLIAEAIARRLDVWIAIWSPGQADVAAWTLPASPP